MRLRPLLAALTMVLTVGSSAGCAVLPHSGDVSLGAKQQPTGTSAPFDFNPLGPRAGANKAEIATGFLNALQATPATTQVAAEFLSETAASSWEPGRRTLIYGRNTVQRHGAGVRVDLSDVAELDQRGGWVRTPPVGGSVRRSADRVLRLRFVRERGEWRLANPPNATVIPQSHFTSRYRKYSLYFFDPTGTVLVPEPVYLPLGVQTPTLLVSALLDGPPAYAGSLERTYIPDGTQLGVGVPITRGVAEVPLSKELLDLESDELDLALAQLAWTLRQVGEITQLRVSVDGAPLELPDGGQQTSINGWSSYDPAISSASTDVFGIRGNEVHELVGGDEITATSLRPLDVSFGRPGSLAVSMSGQSFAVLSADRSRVAVLGRSGDRVRYLSTTRALRPMWDLRDRLWVVNRTPSGATVTVRGGHTLQQLPAPGITGRDIVAAALSRDGSRLAAVRRTPTGPQLVIARVMRNAAGAPSSLTPARPVATTAPLSRPRSIGWRDPTSVAVLTRPTPTTSQVVLASCDGSSVVPGLDLPVEAFFGSANTLVASPGGPLALLLGGPHGRLHALDPQGRWDLDVVDPGLRAPTFVG